MDINSKSQKKIINEFQDNSPIQPSRKKRRTQNKIPDSDDEYCPDANDANHETESDISSPSSSPQS